eukprot:4990359-Karenia_brevis.AAC.1
MSASPSAVTTQDVSAPVWLGMTPSVSTLMLRCRGSPKKMTHFSSRRLSDSAKTFCKVCPKVRGTARSQADMGTARTDFQHSQKGSCLKQK